MGWLGVSHRLIITWFCGSPLFGGFLGAPRSQEEIGMFLNRPLAGAFGAVVWVGWGDVEGPKPGREEGITGAPARENRAVVFLGPAVFCTVLAADVETVCASATRVGAKAFRRLGRPRVADRGVWCISSCTLFSAPSPSPFSEIVSWLSMLERRDTGTKFGGNGDSRSSDDFSIAADGFSSLSRSMADSGATWWSILALCVGVLEAASDETCMWLSQLAIALGWLGIGSSVGVAEVCDQVISSLSWSCASPRQRL
ncbi:hypothetical protein F5X99DRAFT_386295 [Biscogniauxia marginata]|nr:hypothetical protein F5X99DRAFT_386295 [Biscogniauxia marginata]